MTSIAFTGTVKEIKQRPFTSKKTGKPGTAFNILLVDDNGNEFDQIGGIFDPPACSVGDLVSLTATENNNYYNLVKGTLTVVKAGAPAQAAVAKPKAAQAAAAPAATATAAPKAAAPVAEQTGRKTNPEDAKRMTYAAARSAAIEAVRVLLANKALPISGASNKAAEADRNETVLAAIDKLTVKYFHDGLTLRVLETVADTVVSTAGDGAMPDAEGQEGGNLDD